MQYWDQMHRITGKFVEPKYEGCSKWTALEERFLSTCPVKWPKWRSWIGGTYEFSYESHSQHLASVKLTFDWSKGDDTKVLIKWSVDVAGTNTASRAVAYPGRHHGLILHHPIQPEYYEFKWDIPIFSPYVWVGSSDDWQDKIFGQGDGPVVGVSKSKDKTSAMEEVQFAEKTYQVLVLEKVMRSVCALLIFGPTYTDMPSEYEPKERIKRLKSTNRPAIAAFFDKKLEFHEAARFFARAYNVEKQADGGLHVTEEEKRSTSASVYSLLGHFHITQPPFWVTDNTWPDRLLVELQAVKTCDDWRRLERDWATLTSYACALRLHEGPWAGEKWQDFVADRSA